MEIQTYSAGKAREVAELFHQSVHAIDPSLYMLEQKEAWAPTPVDYENWSERLKVKKPFVAIVENNECKDMHYMNIGTKQSPT